MTVDFWHSQSQCLCCRCPRTTCHWPTNLARELQPSLLAKDVSPERKPLKAARRDGCIRRPVGIFICYLVTVSTSKYCISSSHMGAVLTCSLHDEWTKELVPQRLIFILTILYTNSFLSLLYISRLLGKFRILINGFISYCMTSFWTDYIFFWGSGARCLPRRISSTQSCKGNEFLHGVNILMFYLKTKYKMRL